MAVVEKTVLIERTPAQMFALVDGVADYPQFLPWCGGAEVHEFSASRTVATLHINYHGLKSHFSTENDKQFPSSMSLTLRDGPLKHLDGQWRFLPLGDKACKIEFTLNYEFSNKLVEKVLGPVFNHIANTFVESFVQRANQIHG